TTRTAGDGWQFPGDAYSLISALAHLSRMLPQTITQAMTPVADAHQADRLTVDGGADPDQAAAEAVATARIAIRRAMRLAEALDDVHSALSPLGYHAPADDSSERPDCTCG